MSFLCSRQSSGSLSLLVTLALSWTVSWQCRNKYLRFANLVSTTYDNSNQWPDRWHQQLPRQWSMHLYRRFDHCNSLLYGISENLMRRVQSVQNAAARLLTGGRRRDHISPVLRRLHWLPVRRRIDFKLACLVHLSLARQAPQYLAEDIHLVAAGPGCQLRSSTDRSCSVLRQLSLPSLRGR